MDDFDPMEDPDMFEPEEFDDDVDETNYDPYAGQDTPFEDMGETPFGEELDGGWGDEF